LLPFSSEYFVFSLSRNVKFKIYKTIILPVVLYGCETWSLTLRDENRLRVFENRVLRRIFGPKRDEVTGEWRKMYNEELNILYSSPNIMRQTDFYLWGYVKDAVSVPPSNNPTSVTSTNHRCNCTS
jgi:hypothetical protein